MKSLSGPLMSWDLFMEGHRRRMEVAEGFSQLSAFARKHKWRVDWNLRQLLLADQRVVLVTDLEQIIQFATPNMQAMNGYTVDEVLGKNPKIFQGHDTDANTRTLLRQAIVKRIPFSGTLLNYRKDGTPYNCLVDEYPVWNKGGAVVNFIAFEKVA